MQAKIEDRLDLHFGQAVARTFVHLAVDGFDEADIGRDVADRPFAGEQGIARGCRAGRSADDADNFVEIADRDDEAEQDVRPVAGLREFELAAAGDHFLAEGDERLEDRLQPHHFGASAADGKHIGGVEHDLGGRVALQFDDDADALAVRFVADIGDAFDPLVACGLGDFLDQARLADLKGDRGEDDRLAIVTAFLDHIGRAHHDRATARGISQARAALTQHHRAGREIRPRNDRH